MIKRFSHWLTEAVGGGEVDKAMDLISKYLSKKLTTPFVRIPGVEQYKNSSDGGYGIRFFFGKKSIRFNWATASMTGMNLKSIDLWDGTSHDPNWHVEFESAVSLVKIIPNIVDIIKNPKAGTFLSVPEENLNEEILVEATQLSYEDSFDRIVKIIASNTSAIPRAEITSQCGWRGDTLTKWMFDNLPQYFEKEGRAWKWKTQSGSGSVQSTLNGLKDKIFAGVGAVKTTVSRGGTGETYAPTKSEESIDVEKVAFETQLEHLKDLVKLVVKGASHALFVAGRGGTGKTQSVEDSLSALGKTDGDGYYKVTGTSSAVGLFELLFRNRDSMLLFDDADGVVADQDARNLLKAATDTKKVRKIVWNKASKRFIDPDNYSDEMEEEGDFLPKHFEFTGKIIFISNLKIDKLDPDGALRTRALMIDIDPTDTELLNYMEKIVDLIQLEEGGQLGHNARMEVVELLKSGGSKRKDVSLRKLVRGLNMRAALGSSSNWREMVSLYA